MWMSAKDHLVLAAVTHGSVWQLHFERSDWSRVCRTQKIARIRIASVVAQAAYVLLAQVIAPKDY